jgi:tRNA-Thr(GGU) m(6)t(6)A37 methyltransferase TsaA
MNRPEKYSLHAIGTIRSCFKEKFGIPRQPGLNSEARATLELHPPFDREDALRGLEGFSHVWIVFIFHEALSEEWKTMVRPPRLGGNRKVGVFASRSMHRPNPIGISCVQLERIEGTSLLLKGVDLLDGTPVLDIKPYVPFADAIPDADGGFAKAPPGPERKVRFHPEALKACAEREATDLPGLRNFIVQMLQTDPRPAYHDEETSRQGYGIRVFDFDLKWRLEGEEFLVTALEPADDETMRR